MKDQDWEVLARYVRDAADQLGLRDWLLILKHDPPAAQIALAEVRPVQGRKVATIRVCLEFRELTSDEQRQVVLHELLHCHLEEAHVYLRTVLTKALGEGAEPILEAHRLKAEYAVDAIATEVAEHFEHIVWETPDPTREESANAPWEGPIDSQEPAA